MLGAVFAFVGHYNIKGWFYSLWDRSLNQNNYRIKWIDLSKILFIFLLSLVVSIIVLAIKSDE